MIVFFFQAEDGIRDLVRSRGLGDVYKRQLLMIYRLVKALNYKPILISENFLSPGELVVVAESSELLAVLTFDNDESCSQGDVAVSYTHLTLPTSDLV